MSRQSHEALQRVCRIAAALEPLVASVQSLKLDEANARLHPTRSIGAIKASLEAYGQQKPVVALQDGTVIAGNGMLTAALELGWTHIAVNTFEGSASEARAYALADNRTAELSEWDYDEVSKQLSELHEANVALESIGWSNVELKPLLVLEGTSSPMHEHASPSLRAKTVSIKMTQEQHEMFAAAAAKMRRLESSTDMSDGRVVELLSAEYLS